MQSVFGPPFGSIPIQPPLPIQGGFIPPSGGMFSSASAPFSSVSPINPGFGSAIGRGGGGLLARLFGGGGGTSALGGFPATAATSGINFSTILTNTQRVLGITQQVMPMIHQYGPIVRNMPTIWRIMRSNPVEGEAEPTEDISVPVPVQDEESLRRNVKRLPQVDAKPRQFKPKEISGIPGPKLYV
ncbi:VrrA/YqfQ family protein [Halalkalibacter nanhaiisediminis]|uniref:YqfQ-like protein n=1 Tax=Halalkalibacter nanhaiisediminis TaxID=688079 RepID=A0A562QLV7_9BACI|nr:VrrA/YqfQ family protein [Halalkalibacter nanhaiisediminis]TWI57768.1 YqfQ-like protein [Halalkalibacter nanhaiisediminis]